MAQALLNALGFQLADTKFTCRLCGSTFGREDSAQKHIKTSPDPLHREEAKKGFENLKAFVGTPKVKSEGFAQAATEFLTCQKPAPLSKPVREVKRLQKLSNCPRCLREMPAEKINTHHGCKSSRLWVGLEKACKKPKKN